MYPQNSEEMQNSPSVLPFGKAESAIFILFSSPVRLFFTETSQIALKIGKADLFSNMIFPQTSLPFSAVGGKTAFAKILFFTAKEIPKLAAERKRKKIAQKSAKAEFCKTKTKSRKISSAAKIIAGFMISFFILF
jgi:uncharacterized membrane protein